ncbi:MAG: nucleotidyltransferase domain-containing protein [Candidatus Binataceae bacterium]
MTEPKALLEVARALTNRRIPWFVAGGWAIDLHLGRVTRAHNDIDTLILRSDQAALRTSMDFDLRAVFPHPERHMNRGTVARWPAGKVLELPVHQLNAYRPGDPILAEIDAAHIDSGHRYWFQIMLAESDERDWIYRRNSAVRLPLKQLGFHPLWGLPYLAPEVVLLFKAKLMQDKDREDFRNVRPHLNVDARRWLHDALAESHPGHEWLREL